MASITIRKIDDETKRWLRIRAAQHGHSMEEEAREILRSAMDDTEQEVGLGSAIRALVEPLGGVELELPPREPIREPPDFSE